MLGASRESLGRLAERLDERRGAVGFDAVAGELFAVADLLSREKALRSALADAGQPAAARAALAERLLGTRVSPPALESVVDAVRARWSTDADLITALERLAAQAAFTTAEADGTLDRAEEELFRFGRAVDASPQLQMALTDPAQSAATKAAIVRDLLQGRSAAATRTVLEYAVGHLHGQRLDAVVDGLTALAAAQRDRQVAEVRVAAPLTPQQQARLTSALSLLTGRDIRLNVAVDPDVLGGAHVTVGDQVIDGTVATRLAQARRAVLPS